MSDWTSPALGLTSVLTFGKYKTQTVAAVMQTDLSYITWMMQNAIATFDEETLETYNELINPKPKKLSPKEKARQKKVLKAVSKIYTKKLRAKAEQASRIDFSTGDPFINRSLRKFSNELDDRMIDKHPEILDAEWEENQTDIYN